MDRRPKLSLLNALHYLFMGLTAVTALLLLLNLSAYFGIFDGTPFIRGWVSYFAKSEVVTVPHPDGIGDLQLFSSGQQQRLILLNFNGIADLLTPRYLAYLFFQNLAWVLSLLAMYQMSRILRNLGRGNTFPEENTRRIRLIALSAFLLPAAAHLAEWTLAKIVYAAQGRPLFAASLGGGVQNMALGVLVALVVFALAEVFRRGTQLQQEQDLTI